MQILFVYYFILVVQKTKFNMVNAFGFMIVISVLTALVSIMIMVTTPEYKVQSGIVLISGASTGIGRHAAEYLSEKGYIVFAGVRKQSDYESIMDLKNPRLQAIKFDVTNHDSCVNAIQHVSSVSREWKIPVVALVNNAGISRRQTAEFHQLEDIRRVFDTNFFGMVDLTQLALPLLRESEGRIVMVSSVAGVFGAFCFFVQYVLRVGYCSILTHYYYSVMLFGYSYRLAIVICLLRL